MYVKDLAELGGFASSVIQSWVVISGVQSTLISSQSVDELCRINPSIKAVSLIDSLLFVCCVAYAPIPANKNAQHVLTDF